MAIVYAIFHLLALVLGVAAVAIAAAFDYFAWGFVGPFAILTALLVLSRIFGPEVEHKGGFVAGGGAGASAGAAAAAGSAASAASSSGSSFSGGDSSGGCAGGSAC